MSKTKNQKAGRSKCEFRCVKNKEDFVKAMKDVESVYITTEKISKKFDVISGVEIDKINNEDYDKLNV